MTRAIERGAAGDALRELGLMMDNGAVPYMILGQLAWFVRTKVPAPRVGSAVEAVFRTDLAIKTSAGDPRALLERLVVELCARYWNLAVPEFRRFRFRGSVPSSGSR